ncbi:aminopeptidase [Fulvitalea axinellae]|uniref:Aminopeptidase n=1 Tax=Fulvitalea axinellae TaxID=1182444 RepID=A0AAU9CTF4_9BACT|nr:aminopeptidase [Fulvitalea axinellae]
MINNHLSRLMMMAVALFAFGTASAQKTVKNKKDGAYTFTILKNNDAHAVQNQNRTGTCWSFSSLSFFESELARMGKGDYHLSEMFVVRNTYMDKSDRYVRMNGFLNYGPGGAFHDVRNVIRDHGMVPESVYGGLNYGFDKHNHGEMDEVLLGMVKAVVKNKSRRLTDSWKPAISSTLDAYLGEAPKTFEVDGKEYTPESYAKESGLNPDDYVELTSYTHHPFYSKFIIEVPDNWAWDEVYNLPIDEFMAVMENAIEEGYTIAWAADVSEKGFSHKNGLAVVPDFDAMSKKEKEKMWDNVIPELKITQEMRQKAFDDYRTTDDHGMHITGLAKDQDGKKFYIVKNSWGDESNECGGYFYASENFVKYKTMDIMIHKDAIPKNIRKKLGLK